MPCDGERRQGVRHAPIAHQPRASTDLMVSCSAAIILARCNVLPSTSIDMSKNSCVRFVIFRLLMLPALLLTMVHTPNCLASCLQQAKLDQVEIVDSLFVGNIDPALWLPAKSSRVSQSIVNRHTPSLGYYAHNTIPWRAWQQPENATLFGIIPLMATPFDLCRLTLTFSPSHAGEGQVSTYSLPWCLGTRPQQPPGQYGDRHLLRHTNRFHCAIS